MPKGYCKVRKDYHNNHRRQSIINMRLEGLTYQQIAGKLNISRQRVEQIASPPKETLRALITRSGEKCENCGIIVGKSGHAHHKGHTEDTYEDINQLDYLCPSCHRLAHFTLRAKVQKPPGLPRRTREKRYPGQPKIKYIKIYWKNTPENREIHDALKKLAVNQQIPGGIGEILVRVMQEFLGTGKKKL